MQCDAEGCWDEAHHYADTDDLNGYMALCDRHANRARVIDRSGHPRDIIETTRITVTQEA